ncbi:MULTISPECIES: cytochrome c family protein [Bradyrhizobium]|uniref:c-type cytochrome n=1 Tax=Bradyrhizobium TaxID=374 RepID=UPI00039845D6|nr:MULTISPECIES: c-type cytochrome [Bradyrhizobium]ERF85350.1 MAG: cytochrome c [Bradyrhizobium sp. DFCI-1]
MMGTKFAMACAVGSMTLAAALLATSAAPAWALDGDPIAGQAIFQRICQNCHSIDVGVNKVGPSLWHVVGRQPASVQGFDYSDAMRGNKAPWDVTALDAYLADPRGDVHGVKMFFKGLSNARDRADVIAYLQTKQ